MVAELKDLSGWIVLSRKGRERGMAVDEVAPYARDDATLPG